MHVVVWYGSTHLPACFFSDNSRGREGEAENDAILSSDPETVVGGHHGTDADNHTRQTAIGVEGCEKIGENQSKDSTLKVTHSLLYSPIYSTYCTNTYIPL